MIKEKKVRTFEYHEPPVRVRADSMRNTVIVDIAESDYTRKQVFVLPKRMDVIQGLSLALADLLRQWDELQ